MRAEISRIQRDLGVTTIYVTHDQTEAMTMGDRVAVLRGGVLQQVDSPQILYTRPANSSPAEFIGSPAMNLVQGTLVLEQGLGVRFGDHMLQVAERSVRERPALASYLEREIVIGIRPEDIEDAAHVREPSADQTLSVVTDLREDMGAEVCPALLRARGAGAGDRGLPALEHRGVRGHQGAGAPSRCPLHRPCRPADRRGG